MATIDENGVLFYQEGDLFAPVHTALNLQGAALSAVFDTVFASLDDVAPVYRYMHKNTASLTTTNTWTTVTGLSTTNSKGFTGYSGGEWTIPSDGRYEIRATVAYNTNSNGQRVLRLLKNGAVANLGPAQWAQPNIPTTAEINVKMVCNAGDILVFQGNQTSGSSIYAYAGGADSNYFSIERIGSA